MASKNTTPTVNGRSRYLKGTDTPVIRVMGNNRRFFWAVKEADGYRRLDSSEIELR